MANLIKLLGYICVVAAISFGPVAFLHQSAALVFLALVLFQGALLVGLGTLIEITEKVERRVSYLTAAETRRARHHVDLSASQRNDESCNGGSPPREQSYQRRRREGQGSRSTLPETLTNWVRFQSSRSGGSPQGRPSSTGQEELPPLAASTVQS